MPEALVTESDVARMKRGIELYNAGDFDAMREFMTPDIVLERVGGLPPVHGWDAVRAFFEPDAFQSQKIEPLDWETAGDKLLIRTRISSVGAGSGLEVRTDGWFVWTIANGKATRLQAFLDESEARAAAGLRQNDSP